MEMIQASLRSFLGSSQDEDDTPQVAVETQVDEKVQLQQEKNDPPEKEEEKVQEEEEQPKSDSIRQNRPTLLASLIAKKKSSARFFELNGHTTVVPEEEEEQNADTTQTVEQGTTTARGTSAAATATAVSPPSSRRDDNDDVKALNLVRRMSRYTQDSSHRRVEVRFKDFSYYVPIHMDTPSKKTVLNQNIFYQAYEVIRRVSNYCRVARQQQNSNADGSSTADNGEVPSSSLKNKRWIPRSISDIVLPYTKVAILQNINLVLNPGKAYLILGPPQCGKTTLLKAIAGLLKHSQPDTLTGHYYKDVPHMTGRVEYNGLSVQDVPYLVLPNIVSFVGQLDNHAPYLTVRETFEFAFQCRTGGKHVNVGAKTASTAADLDAQHFSENMTIEGLDLGVCADTFVGDENVRGVSGGQRRRVTIGEMMVGQPPVGAADEISTGLDAAVTYDIIHSIVAFSKAAKTTRIVSLLQPGPETFSLFDEVIVLSQGKVIYAGPIEDVVDYFAALGYKQPATMDVADFLQSIPTPDGELLLDKTNDAARRHLSSEGFAKAFMESSQHARIQLELETPGTFCWKDPSLSAKHEKKNENKQGNGDIEHGNSNTTTTVMMEVPKEFEISYQNSFLRSTQLNLKRHLTLWRRDWGFIIGKIFENIGMAVATGGILFGQARLPEWGTDNATLSNQFSKVSDAVYGALFMTSLHILLGTMTSAPDEIDLRSIHYKQADSNFYQSFAYMTGRFLSTIPQRSIEIVSFGIPLYWMLGFDPTAKSFFLYLLLLICYTTGLKMNFSILAQTLPKKANVQGIGTFVVLLATLFGGFIVFPSNVPRFYSWLYWMNPMAWALQGLASIEFMSNKYNTPELAELGLVGEDFLRIRGFQVGSEWIAYSFAFMIPYSILMAFILGIILKYVRIEPERNIIIKKETTATDDKDGSAMAKAEAETNKEESFNIPFTPVDLTFDKIVYEVKASTGDETLRLLNEVSGTFLGGRMCALMGSSGAGKTTLMDVIAMRKTSGTITGEIKLNGHLQERMSFLRSSGYVEQFDVQQPELTVRETVSFCARLRLDAKNPEIGNDAGKMRFVTNVLETMELTEIQNLQVGSFEEGGLTFEQRKRLAIACELAGSPSVLFADEPTSGLDSRGALVVIRALRRISDTGRTVCCTIHQPSSAVFEMFDDLILLKKGGNVVFFGELGSESSKLVNYFESRGASPIQFGENPAAWVLRAYAGEESNEVDWAESYKSSDEFKQVRQQIETICGSVDDKKKLHFDSPFATSFQEQMRLMCSRVVRIYKRSPAYNLARLMIAIFYSFIIGSVFLQKGGPRQIWDENEIEAVVGTMFLSLTVIGIMSISMAVPVTKRIRDVFYKHRASGMLTSRSVYPALAAGETPYLCLISVLYGTVYYSTVGLWGIKSFGMFWVFFTLNVSIYSYFGQAFICLVRDIPTSGGLVGALVGYNIFFSGFVVNPQNFVGPFQLGLWTAPGRFAFEGMVMSQLHGLTAPVSAQFQSPYYFSLNCTGDADDPCIGNVTSYVDFTFGEKFSPDNFWLDLGVLLGYLCLAWILSAFALYKFNYVNT